MKKISPVKFEKWLNHTQSHFNPLFITGGYFIRELTAQIKKLSEDGLTPELIAEKIDLEMLEPPQVKFGNIEGIKFYKSPRR